MERGDQVKQQPLATQSVSGQDLNWMVRIQSSLSFIRVPSRALETNSASRQHTALCLGQKRQGTSTYADDQHKKEKQRASKGSRAWLREGDDPPTHLHSSTILQHACQSQVQIVSAGCAFRKQGPGLVLGYYATGPTSSSRAQGAGGGGENTTREPDVHLSVLH